METRKNKVNFYDIILIFEYPLFLIFTMLIFGLIFIFSKINKPNNTYPNNSKYNKTVCDSCKPKETEIAFKINKYCNR